MNLNQRDFSVYEELLHRKQHFQYNQNQII